MSYLEPSDSEMGILSESEERMLWTWQEEQRQEIAELQKEWMDSVHGAPEYTFNCQEKECGRPGSFLNKTWFGSSEKKVLCHSCANLMPEDADFFDQDECPYDDWDCRSWY